MFAPASETLVEPLASALVTGLASNVNGSKSSGKESWEPQLAMIKELAISQ
jgi:hypothetical protein